MAEWPAPSHDDLLDVSDDDHQPPVSVEAPLSVNDAQVLDLLVSDALTVDADGRLRVADASVTEAMLAFTPGRSEEAVEDIVGGMTGYGLAYDDSQGLISATRQGPNPYDAAQTFEESDVTVSSGDMAPVSGSLALYDTASVTVSYPDNSYAQDVFQGLAFVPQSTNKLGNLEVTPEAQTIEATRIKIVEAGGQTLVDKTGSWTAGNPITFSGSEPLVAGQTYYATLKATENNYNGNVSFPIAGDGINVTGGRSQGGADSRARNISEIRLNGATNGSATVEWPDDRNDLYEWDVATFTHTPDGGSVEAYVQVNDGTGWSRANGGNPIGRNYDLNADSAVSPGDNVRLEFVLSRPDESYNPTVDSAYVSWVV